MLAFKLHAKSHEMCRRAGILSPQLAHYLTLAAHSCLSCLRTARPKPSKKISLSNVNRDFNNSVQVDMFYLNGVVPSYMLCIPAQVFIAQLCQKRDFELLARTENVATLAFFTNEERSESRDQVRRRRLLAAVSTKTVVQRRYSFYRM
jgi:hypothetical protein